MNNEIFEGGDKSEKKKVRAKPAPDAAAKATDGFAIPFMTFAWFCILILSYVYYNHPEMLSDDTRNVLLHLGFST